MSSTESMTVAILLITLMVVFLIVYFREDDKP